MTALFSLGVFAALFLPGVSNTHAVEVVGALALAGAAAVAVSFSLARTWAAVKAAGAAGLASWELTHTLGLTLLGALYLLRVAIG